MVHCLAAAWLGFSLRASGSGHRGSSQRLKSIMKSPKTNKFRSLLVEFTTVTAASDNGPL